METKGLACSETTTVRDDVFTVGLVELQDKELILGKPTKILSGNVTFNFGWVSMLLSQNHSRTQLSNRRASMQDRT